MIKYILLLLFDILLYIDAPMDMNKTFMSICAALAIVKLFLIFFDGKSKSYNLSKVYLRHSTLFAICFFIVFFQSDIDFILGIADVNDYFVYNPRVVCRAMCLSNIAFTCFLLGYSYNKTRERLLITSGHNLRRPKIESFENKYLLNYLVFFVIVVYLALFSGTEYTQNGWEIAGVIIGYTVAVFVAIYVSYSLDYKENIARSLYRYMAAPLALVLVFAAIVVLTGRRTEVVRCGLLVLCSYVFVKREKVNYKFILLFSIVALLVISVTGIIRGNDESIIDGNFLVLQDVKSVFPPTKELSTSVNTLHIAMANVPSGIPYNLGSSFFTSFLKIVPGLTGAIQSLFGIKFVGSETIISDIYFGSRYHGWGMGSSIVADVYISFGPIGVIIVFFLFGRFLRWLEVETYMKVTSIYIVALSFSCYSQLMFACRSGVGILFLCWAYACILLFLIKKRTKRRV